MKKIGLVLAVVLSAAVPLVAQDTLLMYYPKSTYYSNGWPDSSQRYSHNYVESNDRADMWANSFYTDDTLTIYGIATALFTIPEDIRLCEDRDPTHAVEYLKLFEFDPVEVLREVAEPLPVCAATTRPAYYWKLEEGSGLAMECRPYDAFPVYECYFSEPYVVYDSFCVGMTSSFWTPKNEDGHHYAYATVPYYNLIFSIGLVPAPYYTYEHIRSTNRWESWWTKYVFIMPIIAIDSTIWPNGAEEEDNAIEEATTANHFVVVSPNPATGEVKVTSTVGMTRVEVYNADGVKVMEKATASSEVQTRLDVSRLHSGNYIVRVYTPMGMAIKKLVVQ